MHCTTYVPHPPRIEHSDATSVLIAVDSNLGRGADYTTEMTYRRRELRYDTISGWCYTVSYGAMAAPHWADPVPLTRGEAISTIVNHCRNEQTGYGYTREQAEAMVAGAESTSTTTGA